MKSNKLLIFCNLLYFYNKLHWLLIIKNYLTVNIVYSMLVFIKITSKLKIIWHRIVLICRYRFIMEPPLFLSQISGSKYIWGARFTTNRWFLILAHCIERFQVRFHFFQKTTISGASLYCFFQSPSPSTLRTLLDRLRLLKGTIIQSYLKSIPLT